MTSRALVPLTDWLRRLHPQLPFILTITACTLFLYRDLVDIHGFMSHDLTAPYVRAEQFATQLSSGHIPPQLMPDTFRGAGYAFFRFYPPLSIAVSAALSWLTGNYILGVNLSYLLSVLLSGLSLYFMGCVLSEDRWIALAGALLYISLPYRFVDVFVRGALAESWTFFWYPLIVAGLWKALKGRAVPWYLPCAIGGLVLTHNLTALYFLTFCIVPGVLVFIWEGWRTGGILLANGLIGLGLSLWFVIPQQSHLATVLAGDPQYMGADAASLDVHKVYAAQFLSSDASRWYGDSFAGPNDGMSFELGTGQLWMLLVVAACAVRLWRGQQPTDRRLLILGAIFLVTWIVDLLFMIAPLPFLQVLPAPYAYLQFPWRLLGPAAFLATTVLLLFSAAANLPRAARRGLAAVSLLLVFLVPSYQHTKRTEPGWVNEALTTENIVANGWRGYTSQAEYLPRDFLSRLGIDANHVNLQAIYRALGENLQKIIPDAPQVIGDGALLSWNRDRRGILANVELRTPSTVVFPLIFYDTYSADADGTGILPTYSADGLLAVQAPAGARMIRVTQRMDRPLKVGIAISLVSAIALVFLILQSPTPAPSVSQASRWRK